MHSQSPGMPVLCLFGGHVLVEAKPWVFPAYLHHLPQNSQPTHSLPTRGQTNLIYSNLI